MKQLLMFFLCMCLCVPVMAQMDMGPDGDMSAVGANYQTTESYGLADNIGNCVANNCLVTTNRGSGGGQVSFVQVSTGYDGTVMGLDGAGNVWSIPLAPASGGSVWSKIPAMTNASLKQIAVRNSGEIFALMPTVACNGSGYKIYKWGGSSWVGVNGCLQEISITADDTLVGFTAYGMWYTLNPNVSSNNPTWTHLNTVSNYSHVAGVSFQQTYVTIGNTLYSMNLSSGVATLVAGNPPSVANTLGALTASPDGFLFVVAQFPGRNGNLFSYNSQSGTWINLLIAQGTSVSFVGGNSRFFLFAQSTTNILSHVLMLSVTHTTTTTGYYDCGVSNAGCPQGAMHTVYAYGNFTHSSNPNQSDSVTVTPWSTASVSHLDTSLGCDVLYNDWGGVECLVSNPTGKVVCSIMGGIFTRILNFHPIQSMVAYTRVYYIGVGGHDCIKDNNGFFKCLFDVANWCTAATTPPLVDFTGHSVKDTKAWLFWDTFTPCLQVFGFPWQCADFGFENLTIASGFNVPNPPLGNCTKI